MFGKRNVIKDFNNAIAKKNIEVAKKLLNKYEFHIGNLENTNYVNFYDMFFTDYSEYFIYKFPLKDFINLQLNNDDYEIMKNFINYLANKSEYGKILNNIINVDTYNTDIYLKILFELDLLYKVNPKIDYTRHKMGLQFYKNIKDYYMSFETHNDYSFLIFIINNDSDIIKEFYNDEDFMKLYDKYDIKWFDTITEYMKTLPKDFNIKIFKKFQGKHDTLKYVDRLDCDDIEIFGIIRSIVKCNNEIFSSKFLKKSTLSIEEQRKMLMSTESNTCKIR